VSLRQRRRLQLAVACASIVVYAALSQYSNTVGNRSLGTALAVAPLSLLVVALAWRWTPVAALGAAAAWTVLQSNFSLVSLLQQSGADALLGYAFARTLYPHEVALCTRLADRVHGPLSQPEVAYTRRVTAAWAVFFFTSAAVSIVLYAAAPLWIWSIYAYFCTLPLMGVMFLAEYGIRRRVLPAAGGGLMATLRVYFASPET
jgi:uncharacterized membrane protein